MANNTSQHILSTSANLLGFCLFVITSLKLNTRAETQLICEVTSIISVVLAFSCGFSFISLKVKESAKEKILEAIANYLFIISLAGILVVILMITRNFINK